ncbi:MAG: Do family serine endopeptidase [Spirochaetaceae bacterium]
MGSGKALYSRKFFLANLVMVGIIVGFVLSVVVFSCSTGVRPGDTAAAEQPGVEEVDISAVEGSFRRVANAVMPSVVKITVAESDEEQPEDFPWFEFFFEDRDQDQPQRPRGLGSGVVVRRIEDTYYALTNDHVVAGGDNILVTLDDRSEIDGELVGNDSRRDLAMISFETDQDIPVARLGDSDNLAVGDWVLAIGSPFGLQSTVTAGIVSALERRGGPQGNISDFIQTDAAINQGNSGGALVNLRGEIVGINTWITSQTGGSIGLGFSIPVNNARRVIEDFIESGQVQYGWLGVSIREPSGALAEDMEVDGMDGAFVYHVFKDSPADEGGVLPGDFMTAIDGEPVKDADDFILRVGDLKAGETVEFELIRLGEPTTIEVTIGRRADEETIAEQSPQAWPGMSIVPLTDSVRERVEGETDTEGVLVINVESRTPAAAAGFRRGDLITEMNDSRVRSAKDFYRELNDPEREEIEFTYLRDDDEQTVSIVR